MSRVSNPLSWIAEVQMAHSKHVVLLVVLIALALASVGGSFEVVPFDGGFESFTGLHW
jgi:hypothetical protein